ncbi:MarR family winged helix-turn-helix transcriptional regulator [Actinomyces faecalis]|uniref:MarR family winged helix-turn-helix transcriptional regulator n=1 Tax=Actinomyces faecalis TaxID=2722820 RepID=UPI001F311BD8|nr:MarR family transcriptional regulator [Actinomyces faecalis]
MTSAHQASVQAVQGGAGTPAVSGCGQASLDAPVAGCGQGSLEPSACGQGSVETSACGQEAMEEDAATDSCGQAASGCGQTSPRLLNAQEMAAWRAFLAASISVTGSLNHELETEAGLSMHEYEILVRLSEAPGHSLRMSALAEHVSHSRSRLTHTVGRLEKGGYVERSSCSSDRRGVNCHLTETGMDVLRAAAPVHLDGVRRHVIERLQPGQLELFTSMLSALADPDEQL